MNPALQAILFASAWTPAQLEGSLDAWWDASDPTTLTLNGSTVSAWQSKANGISAAQGTQANQPTLTAAGLNGLPVVTFGGTHWLTVASVSFATGADFIVCKASADSQGFFQHGAVNGQFSLLTDATATLFARRSGTAHATIAYVAGSPMLVSAYYTNNLSRIYLNGVVGTDNTAAQALSTTATNHEIGRLGASTFPLIGFIAERVRLNAIPDDPTRQKVEGYLAWKWGLQGSLPATHPYKNRRP